MAHFVRNIRQNANSGSFTLYYSELWPSCVLENSTVEWRELHLLSKTLNKWNPWSSEYQAPFFFLCCWKQFLQVASWSYVDWWYALPEGSYVQLVLGCKELWKVIQTAQESSTFSENMWKSAK